ncbi:MAG: hypothetical protein WC849_03620 [Candidatus Paceibacterota bacterium]
MIYIILFLIILIVFYKIFSFRITTYFLEKRISEIQPSVIEFLNNRKKEREETLKKFNENDLVVKMFEKSSQEIVENIEDIKKDLYLVNNCEIVKLNWLKMKGGKKDKVESEVSLCFLKYLECLDRLRRLSHIDVSVLPQGAQQEHINRIFETLREKEKLYEIFDYVINKK